MARITKSDRAPQEPLHFTFGTTEFDLADAGSVFETDDPSVIATARANMNLKVEDETSTTIVVAAEKDMLDPHQNPAADHLSAQASPAAVSAAVSNEKAIKAAAGLDITAPSDKPTVPETLQAMFNAVGVRGEPSTMESAAPTPEPATPPAPPAAAPDLVAVPASPLAPSDPTPKGI